MERRELEALGLFTLITRLPLLTYPKACDDEQVYAVVAMEMLRGGKPYIDAVERKPPLLFYLYEMVMRLGGAYHYVSLHVAALAWTLGTVITIYFLVRGLFDAPLAPSTDWERARITRNSDFERARFAPSTGFVAALFYAIFIAWADYTNLAFNGELLMNLPVTLAFLLTFERSSKGGARALALVCAGALVAVAFLLKQPSVIASVPLAVYVLHPRYRRTRGLGAITSLLHAALLAAGFALALALVGAFLYREGILDEAWYWSIGNHANPLGPTTWFFWHKLPLTGLFFVAETLPLLILAALALREGLGTRRGAVAGETNEGTGEGANLATTPVGVGRAPTWSDRPAEFLAVVLLLAGSLLGVAANGQFLYHYFLQLTPALAILAAPVFTQILRRERTSKLPWLRPRVLVVWVSASALLFFIVDTIGLARGHVRVPKPTAVYVREHSREDDRLFMWGQGTAQTGLYLDSERRPATRYIASFPLNGIIFGLLDKNHDTHYHIVPGSWRHLAEDFAAHPPKFIIDCHAVRDGTFYQISDYPYLRDLLAAQYREVFRAPDGVVYARQTDGPLPPGLDVGL